MCSLVLKSSSLSLTGCLMRDYGKVSPQFWIGKTGRDLKAQGPEALIVSMYLLTNPHANMIGMYYLPVVYIAHETGLGLEGAWKGLRRGVEVGFCHYDDASEVVWVPEMATYQIAVSLKANDNRCVGIQKEYDAQPKNAFLSEFYEKYKDAFHLRTKRNSSAENGRGVEGASKPLGSQEQEQEKEQDKPRSNAGVRENNRPGPNAANAVIDDRPPSRGSPAAGKFEMYAGWRPDDDFLMKAAQWGLTMTEPPEETVLAEFVTYWCAEGKAFHHAQWEQKFAQSLKHQRARKPTGDKRDETNRRADGYCGPWRGDSYEATVAAMAEQLRGEGHDENDIIKILAGNAGDLFGSVGGQEREGTDIALERSHFISE